MINFIIAAVRGMQYSILLGGPAPLWCTEIWCPKNNAKNGAQNGVPKKNKTVPKTVCPKLKALNHAVPKIKGSTTWCAQNWKHYF